MIPPGPSTPATPPPPEATPSKAAQNARRKRLREARRDGINGAEPPQEINSSAVSDMLERKTTVARYLAVTAELDYPQRPDYDVFANLRAACEHFSEDLTVHDPPWLPVALVDLDSGEDLIETLVITSTALDGPANSGSGEAASFSDAELTQAANRASEDILTAIATGGEGPRDLVNLVVNATAHYLRQPDATLAEAIAACYSEPASRVLEWARR